LCSPRAVSTHWGMRPESTQESLDISASPLDRQLLLAVLELGPAAYGANLHRSVEKRSGLSASISSVYRALDRLEFQGLLKAHEQTLEVRGARRRVRIYDLTPEGAAELGSVVDAVRQTYRALGERARNR